MAVAVRKNNGRTELSFSTALAPQAVFDYLSDFSRHSEWCRDIADMDPETEGHPDAGTRYRTTEAMREGSRMKSTTFCEITALDPPRFIEWKARTKQEKGPMAMRSYWAFRIEPEGAGCRVTQEYELQPPNKASRVMLFTFTRFADLIGGLGASPRNVHKHAEALEARLSEMAASA